MRPKICGGGLGLRSGGISGRGGAPTRSLPSSKSPMPDHVHRPVGLAVRRLRRNMLGAGPRLEAAAVGLGTLVNARRHRLRPPPRPGAGITEVQAVTSRQLRF